jgi:hypothetical protein
MDQGRRDTTGEGTGADVAGETAIFAQAGAMRSPLASRLLRWAIWLVLIPFGLDLLISAEALLRQGMPQQQYLVRLPFSVLFDPIYQTCALTLVAIVALLWAFSRFVPCTFQQLAGQGVISEKEQGQAQAFVQTHRRWLGHRARFLVGAVFAVTGAVIVYCVAFEGDPHQLLPGSGPYAVESCLARWITGLGIQLTLFVLGSWLFDLFVTAVLIRRLPMFFELDVQLAHPDRCGGFKAIGDLCLKMVYVVLAPALFVSFWLIVSKHVPLAPELQALLPPYVLAPGFRTPAKVLLGLLAVSGVAVFFWPMYAVHRLMLAERVGLQQTLDGIARQVHRLNQVILADPSSMSTDEREQTLAEIDSLKELYERTRKIPAWPFERSVALKFISTQTIPILSLIGLGGPLSNLVEIVISLF